MNCYEYLMLRKEIQDLNVERELVRVERERKLMNQDPDDKFRADLDYVLGYVDGRSDVEPDVERYVSHIPRDYSGNYVAGYKSGLIDEELVALYARLRRKD